jgi:hypothetical protein
LETSNHPRWSFPFVNFDVTALVALCSDVCNGHSDAEFPHNPVLQQQAVSERGGEMCIENYLAPALRLSTVDKAMLPREMRTRLAGPLHGDTIPSPSTPTPTTAAPAPAAAAGPISTNACDATSPMSAADAQELEMQVGATKAERRRQQQQQRQGQEGHQIIGQTARPAAIDIWLRHGMNALGFLMGREPNAAFWREAVESSAAASSSAQQALEALRGRDQWGAAPGAQSVGLPPHHLLQKLEALGDATLKVDPASGQYSYWPGNWVCALQAVEEFAWIVETISGPEERARAAWVLQRMRILDIPPAHITEGLRVVVDSGRVKERQLSVFGCADVVGAVTLTANRAFLFAACEFGQGVAAAVHPARALTERKRLGVDTRPTRSQFHPSNRRIE